jgi:hypothetical protein
MKYTAKKLEVSAGIIREQETRIMRRRNGVAKSFPSGNPADALQAAAHPAAESDIDKMSTLYPGTQY